MKPPRLRLPGKGSPPFNALTKHSLLGSAAELERHALEQKPLLGDVCLTGEATVWYAKYGTGKTLLLLHLLIEAVQDGRIEAGLVVYIDADDSSAGLAQKVRLLEDYGVHVLAQRHRGFRASAVAENMAEMVRTGTAKGHLVIFDTLKKFVDVIDKKATRAFNEVVRQFVMQGGTVLALAHVNKRLGPDGKPIPEGTADVLNDFDCAYLLDCAGVEKGTGNVVVEFTRIKNRGLSALKAHYTYDPAPQLTYSERLCSIQAVDPDNDEFEHTSRTASDEANVIEAIELCMKHGTVTKMDIVRTTSQALGVSRRRALEVLEKFTGDDPEVHRWNFTRREHGRMVYGPLGAAEEPS